MHNRHRNLAIDAIKGLMIILIILHHSRLVPTLRHGYLGVDVFFIIAGYFLMQSFIKKKGTAFGYTIHRLKQVYLPYLISLGLACILDYKRLTSFQGFDGFIETYAPFSTFLTLTEEAGFIFHSPVILVGGWYLSVLVIGGFLLYGLLEFNEKLTTKVLLPFSLLLGYTFIFSEKPSLENFSIIGAVSVPLLRGFLDMGLGVMLHAVFTNEQERLGRHRTMISIASILAFMLFCAILWVQKPLDSFLLLCAPLFLTGSLLPDTWLQRLYNGSPTKVLPFLGRLSLELYLIHQPILHIVHSSFKFLHLPINAAILIPVDLAAVLFSAVALHQICLRIQSK